MEQQTAVEWLFRQMTSTWYDTNCGKTILKQAKKIERQQFIDFADNVRKNQIAAKDAEKYYNQIYTDGTI